MYRGYREVLDGRLCRPDSEQRPLVSNFTTVAIVKLCCHNFTQIANFVIFFVSSISYRPTDLSFLKEFSKNVFLIVTIFPLSLLSRSSRCPRLHAQVNQNLIKTVHKAMIMQIVLSFLLLTIQEFNSLLCYHLFSSELRSF